MSFGEFFTGVAGIGKAYEDGLQRNALAALGQQIQGGDIAGAAKTAFDAGDPGTGLKLLAYGQQARKDALGAEATRDLVTNFGLGGPQAPPAAGNGLEALGARAPGGVPSFLDVGSGPQGNYLAGLFKRESNNNPTAQASTSSARGLGQFTRGTWNQVAAQHPDLGLTPVGNGQDGRIDPQQMIRATQAHTADNEGLLKQSGLPVNDATKYSLHIFGSGGGRRFVAGTLSNPDAPAASYVNPDQVAANRPVFFRRDGTPKTAGEVMGDFSRSFGGGGAPASRQASAGPGLPSGASGLNPARPAPAPQQRPVAFADDEAQTQALEQRMGMVPPAQPQRQATSFDPQADMPAPGAQEAAFVIPPGPGGGAPQALPSSDPNSRASAAGPIPTLGGGAPAGRVMSMPGDPAAAPASPPSAPAAPIPAGATIGNVPAAAIAQAPPPQRIQALQRALLNPNTPDNVREFASTMLKQTLDESRMPDGVKEFVWARSHGMTQAQSPAAYAQEKMRNPGADLTSQIEARQQAAARLGLQPGTPEFRSYALTGKEPTDRDEGAKISAQVSAREREGIRLGMQPGSPELQSYALGNRPAAERQTEAEKISGAIEARRQAAAGLGLQEGSPSWRSFVATGKVGADRDMSAADKKLIETADNSVLAANSTISALNEAKELSKKAYGGPWAGKLSTLGNMVGIGTEAAEATQNLDNLLTTNALGQLRSIFGGNPTEGERAILLEIQGSSAKPDAVRQTIYDRGIKLAQLRLQQNQDKADALREGRYFRQGGNPTQQQGTSGGGQSGAPALPPPSPSNRPGAVSPADRFGQLVGSGMSKAAAYQQLHQEGY